MKYGERLRAYRESRHMSIYKLSQLCGVSQGHINDLENGINQPTIETLKKLLDPLGYTLAEFFNEDGDVMFLSDCEKELVSEFRTLPTDKADLYLQLGRALNQT